jgi:hypothetical protein
MKLDTNEQYLIDCYKTPYSDLRFYNICNNALVNGQEFTLKHISVHLLMFQIDLNHNLIKILNSDIPLTPEDINNISITLFYKYFGVGG